MGPGYQKLSKSLRIPGYVIETRQNLSEYAHFPEAGELGRLRDLQGATFLIGKYSSASKNPLSLLSRNFELLENTDLLKIFKDETALLSKMLAVHSGLFNNPQEGITPAVKNRIYSNLDRIKDDLNRLPGKEVAKIPDILVSFLKHGTDLGQHRWEYPIFCQHNWVSIPKDKPKKRGVTGIPLDPQKEKKEGEEDPTIPRIPAKAEKVLVVNALPARLPSLVGIFNHELDKEGIDRERAPVKPVELVTKSDINSALFQDFKRQIFNERFLITGAGYFSACAISIKLFSVVDLALFSPLGLGMLIGSLSTWLVSKAYLKLKRIHLDLSLGQGISLLNNHDVGNFDGALKQQSNFLLKVGKLLGYGGKIQEALDMANEMYPAGLLSHEINREMKKKGLSFPLNYSDYCKIADPIIEQAFQYRVRAVSRLARLSQRYKDNYASAQIQGSYAGEGLSQRWAPMNYLVSRFLPESMTIHWELSRKVAELCQKYIQMQNFFINNGNKDPDEYRQQMHDRNAWFRAAFHDQGKAVVQRLVVLLNNYSNPVASMISGVALGVGGVSALGVGINFLYRLYHQIVGA